MAMSMAMAMAMPNSQSLKASPVRNLYSELVYVSSSVISEFSRFRFQAKAPMNFTCRLKSNSVYEDLPAVGEDLPPDYEEWMPKKDPKDRRRAGILLHPTSFRGPYGIGDLGEEAYRFLDWLQETGCSVWQVCVLFGWQENARGKSGVSNSVCLTRICRMIRKGNEKLSGILKK